MFNSEKILVNVIIENIVSGQIIDSPFKYIDNYKILREINLGYGTADIVVAQYNNEYEFRSNFLNYFEILLYHVIRDNSEISLDSILNKTKASIKKIEKSIEVLESENYIIHENGIFLPIKEYKSDVKKSVAIEAKLKNWKRALKQAYRYKWFSGQSYVILPTSNIKPALENIIMFKNMNVGLASVCFETGIEIHFNPEEENPISQEMHMLLNECVLSNLCAS